MLQDYSFDAAKMCKQVMGLLRPYKLKGANKVRVGRHFDGGYMMLDEFDGVEAAYSLGINDDTSWDLDMAQRGVKIMQFDHTIEGPPYPHPLFHWQKIGIAGHANPDEKLDTLEHLVEVNGHRGNNNLVLKCDIEDAEWSMLIHTPNSLLRQFSQIVIELHNLYRLADLGAADGIRAALGNLAASHRVVHVHGNNYGGVAIVGGYTVPCSLEVSLARRDLGEFELSDESFPTAVDMPCNKDASDIYLGRFDFG